MCKQKYIWMVHTADTINKISINVFIILMKIIVDKLHFMNIYISNMIPSPLLASIQRYGQQTKVLK